MINGSCTCGGGNDIVNPLLRLSLRRERMTPAALTVNGNVKGDIKIELDTSSATVSRVCVVNRMGSLTVCTTSFFEWFFAAA